MIILIELFSAKKIKSINESPYLGKETFSIVNNSLIRISPNGSLVISEKMINNVLYLDKDVVDIIKQPIFSLYNLPKYIVDNLLEKQIVEMTEKPNKFKKFICENAELPYYGRIEVTDVCQCHYDICYKNDNETFEPSLSILKK